MAKEIVTDLYRDTPSHPNKKLLMDLPLPVSINHMYYNTKHGGKRLTARAEAYVRVSRALINLAIQEQNWYKQSKSVWYYIDLVFYLPDRRVRDSHNMIKLLLDVIQGLAYENDYYIIPRIQAVEYDAEAPRVMACISPQTHRQRIRGIATCD